MTKRPISYMIACVAAFYAFSATAATVVPYTGDVFVSRGNGFQKIKGATLVKVGDTVMVSPGGLAQVQLEDGNVVTVSPGEMLNVPAKARSKDAALPDGAHLTQVGGTGSWIGGVAALAGEGALIGTAVSLSQNNGSAQFVPIVPASP